MRTYPEKGEEYDLRIYIIISKCFKDWNVINHSAMKYFSSNISGMIRTNIPLRLKEEKIRGEIQVSVCQPYTTNIL